MKIVFLTLIIISFSLTNMLYGDIQPVYSIGPSTGLSLHVITDDSLSDIEKFLLTAVNNGDVGLGARISAPLWKCFEYSFQYQKGFNLMFLDTFDDIRFSLKYFFLNYSVPGKKKPEIIDKLNLFLELGYNYYRVGKSIGINLSESAGSLVTVGGGLETNVSASVTTSGVIANLGYRFLLGDDSSFFVDVLLGYGRSLNTFAAAALFNTYLNVGVDGIGSTGINIGDNADTQRSFWGEIYSLSISMNIRL